MGRPTVLKVDIIADAKGVGRGVADADRQLSGFSGTMKKHGAAIGAGLAVGVAAVGAFAASSIRSASEVEQSMGAVDSVFGRSGAKVKEWADGAATAVGLSKNEYAGLAAVVGSQLQGMGVEQDASAAKTNDLIKTGADLAATFGGSVSDAVGAVGSLLRGERDPIEKYGVSITAADVAARLAATGQDKLTGAALKTAQSQATLALLTEKTKNATGAFTRESDTAAHQQQVLSAQFENVKATVGAKLLPVLTGLGTKLVEVAGFVERNRAVIGPLVAIVGGLVGVVLAVNAAARAYTATQAALNIVMTANPVGLVVLAIAALVAGVILAYKHSETFRTGVNSLWALLKKLVGFTPFGALLLHLDEIVDKVKAVGSAIKNSPIGMIGKLNPFSAPILGMVSPTVGGVGSLAPKVSRLATAGLGDSDLSGAGFGQWWSPSGGGVVLIDRRTIDARVFVDGALDAPGVARQLADIQRDQAVRLGRTTAYSSA